jgi:hypothetical protein
MFAIDTAHPTGARLKSDAVMTPQEFREVAKSMKGGAFKARKTGLVAVRTALETERVETRWNGKETTNTAAPGDRIVTSLDGNGVPMVDGEGHRNVYVIKPEVFVANYEITDIRSDLGAAYRSIATVEAIHFPGGFDIVAPWGEAQRAADGFLLLNGTEVYGNNAETFRATYTWDQR